MQRINSPIEVQVTPQVTATTFHTVKLRVTANATDCPDVSITLSAQVVTPGAAIIFDISSVLRAAADAYTFTPDNLSIPDVAYASEWWEEYLDSGELIKTDAASVASGTALFGGYTDYERITNTQPTTHTRKPLTSIETVAVGDTFIAPLPSAGAPRASAATPITEGGIQQVNGHTLYAVPQNRNRHQFRFINGLGAMESVSIECYADESVTYNTEQFQQTRPDYMGGISHTRIEKSLDIEQWKFSTGPLTRDWRHWYAHEFLMAKHVWLQAPSLEGRDGVGSWLPVLIIPEETTPLINRVATDLPSIDFTVKMNFNG